MKLEGFTIALADVKGKSQALALRIERSFLPPEKRYEIEKYLGGLGRIEHPVDLAIQDDEIEYKATGFVVKTCVFDNVQLILKARLEGNYSAQGQRDALITALGYLAFAGQAVDIIITEKQMSLPFAPIYEGKLAPPEVVEARLAALPVDDGEGVAESEAVAITVEDACHKPDPIHTEIMKELKAQQEQYE